MSDIVNDTLLEELKRVNDRMKNIDNMIIANVYDNTAYLIELRKLTRDRQKLYAAYKGASIKVHVSPFVVEDRPRDGYGRPIAPAPVTPVTLA